MPIPGQLIAIFALSNAMLGGILLVIPLLGITTGFLLIPVATLLYGLISFYTCHLVVLHMGNCKTVKQSILQHFGNRKWPVVIYNTIIILVEWGTIINYFQLAAKQLEGFFFPSPLIGLAIFLLILFLTVIMRILHFGEKLMAIGILSIVGYCCFIVWAFITTPQGPKRIPSTGEGFIDISASLTMGFAMHDFVGLILLKTTTPDKYNRVVIIAFIIGICVYTFLSFACYAIVNRTPRVSDPETILDYFPYSGWQVRFIELIYLFHLITASPELTIILKTRFYQIFDFEQISGISFLELLTYVTVYGSSFFLYYLNIKIATVIEINGAIVGFLYIFLMPIIIHIKCTYFNVHDPQGYMMSEKEGEGDQIIEYYGDCQCKLQYRNNYTKLLELVLLIAILTVGILNGIYTMHNLFFKEEMWSSRGSVQLANQIHLAQWFYGIDL